MAFQFGFAAEDGDDIATNGEVPVQAPQPSVNEQNSVNAVPVHEHSLEELLATLPSQLSYSTVEITSPLGRTAVLPRRELFDVRIQLMAEDEGDGSSAAVEPATLDKTSDLRAGVYEGGFKTWESSVDLASLLLDRGPRKDIDELARCGLIVELGAGTALPSLTLFRHCVANPVPGLAFTLADYNHDVLRLVTLPNLLLTFAAATSDLARENKDTSNIFIADPLTAQSKGELEITPALLTAFRTFLTSNSMTLTFLSGPWSHTLASLIPACPPDLGAVILAAETIYSPASTAAFVDLLEELLKRVRMAKAMVGAKRVYFGVGGSVDALKEACREKGMVAYEIENHGVRGMDGPGVGRALVEVQMY